MIFSKKDAARIQLEKAIELFLNYHDLLNSLTLAGAAEEILGVLTKRETGSQPMSESLLEKLKEWNPDIPSEQLKKEINCVRNALKHANDKAETHVFVSEETVAVMIMRACLNFLTLERKYTDSMRRFSDWYEKEYGHLEPE